MMRFLLGLLILLCLWACKKNEIELESGIIYYSGSYADDKCGYVLQIADQNYSPRNLPDYINADTTKVQVRITKLEDFAFCGFGVEPLQIVNVREIDIIN